MCRKMQENVFLQNNIQKLLTILFTMPPKKYKTIEQAKAAKRASNRESARLKRGSVRRATVRQKRFVELLPLSKSATQAAIQAGYSSASAGEIACENLKKPSVIKLLEKQEKNLKQAFKEAGVDEDYFAVNLKNLVEYNKQVVIEVVGVGASARDVERMRDAKVVSSTLLQMAKLSGASLENTQNLFASELSVDTMLLAMMGSVKKLAQLKLSKPDLLLLKEISQSIDALFDKSLQIVG